MKFVDPKVVELPKFRKKLEELQTQLDRWLYFLKYADDLIFVPDQLSPLQDAFDVLNEVTWDDQRLAQYRQEEEQLGPAKRCSLRKRLGQSRGSS